MSERPERGERGRRPAVRAERDRPSSRDGTLTGAPQRGADWGPAARAATPDSEPQRTGSRPAGPAPVNRQVRSGQAANGPAAPPQASRPAAPRQAAPRQARPGLPPDSGSTRVVAAPTRPSRQTRRGTEKATVSHRGRRVRRDRSARVNTRLRTRGALGIVLALLTVALVRLVTIQTVDAQTLSAAGLSQGSRTLPLYAERGSIEDRNGTPLAFSVQGRAIAARPGNFQNDTQRGQVADILVAALGPQVSRPELMKLLTSTKKYVYLARSVMPAMTDSIMARIKPVLRNPKATVPVQNILVNAVVTEIEQIRTTPDGGLASVVGTTGRTVRAGSGQAVMVGRAGIESKFDALLNGKDGSRTLQIDSRGNAIPNTTTKMVVAVNGTGIRLTLDSDLQFSIQRMLESQVAASQAKGGCAVVKGISDGQIYAMACTQTGKTAAQIGNPAVSIPFEPGSVNKIVTFAPALERGLITPTTVMSVNGQIAMGGREIHDAWSHGPIDMTATGVLGKSSNVGTLLIAQKVGPSLYAQELAKFGLGRKTGIELPGESAGSYPAQSQWSATSFANLPIGQGVSMTLLQLVDMYQAVGNKGVLVAPTIIAGTTKDGVYTPAKVRSTSTVMKPTTAATLLSMLRGTVQSGDLYHRGTGKSAALNGYQVAGKTGTAQQIDPVTKAYSSTLTTATFAGVVPADNPKFAIAIMLDAPKNGSEGGESAAPLFHQIAGYVLRANDVAPSPSTAPVFDLYVPPAG